MESSLEKVGRENSLRKQLSKGDLEQSLNNRITYISLKLVLEPYLWLDLLCLAFIYARHSRQMQDLSGFGIENCLAEESLGWSYFENSIKISFFINITVNYL